MNLTLSSLLQSCLATLAYLVLLLPAGYFLARLCDIVRFRSGSATEKCLWSISLSLPLGLFVTNFVGRYLHPRGAFFVLVALCLAGLISMLFRSVPVTTSWHPGSYGVIVLIALGAEVFYIWCAGTPLQFGHRLYEPVFTGDWEVRFPLIRAAMRDGVPPHNPFFTFKGQSPPMRYYYYWYSLCGLVANTIHTDPRASLLASSVFACLSIVAILFLYQKYMVSSAAPLRQRCALLLGVCCVLGLDVVPSTVRLLFWRVHLLPEIEWWSQDRTPGLPAVIIYAPHHVAGAVCGLLAFLLLALLVEESRPAWRSVLIHGSIGALAFAALVGTSTFICIFFGLACTALAVQRLLHGDRRPAAALLIAATLSVSVSTHYLHELLARTVSDRASGQHRHLLVPKLRHNNFAHSLVWKLSLVLHKAPPLGLRRFLLRLPVLPMLYLCETGFFLIVLWVKYREDFRSGRSLNAREKALWILAASVGFFFLFVSSEGVQSINDLGLQAGLVLRLIFVLWGAQVIAQYLLDRRERTFTPGETWLIRLAGVFLVLGLSMTVWQAVVERTYAILADRRILPAISPYPYAYHIGAVYLDIYQAQAAAAQLLPADSVVQSDPRGRYQTIFRLYQIRRQAAGDESCEGAFGGDPELCQSFVPALLRLFGSHLPLPDKRLRGPKPNPLDMTTGALAFVCAQDGIAAVAASRADPVWYDPESWVWHGSVLYQNATVRIIRCPVS